APGEARLSADPVLRPEVPGLGDDGHDALDLPLERE
ncbi:MAG: hypothetical protein AVDCRST_MAG33-2388, partial [uncultured Thermomicrobiales bacterium]